jgi:uncharacterized protein (DUF2147 family)
MRHGTTLVAAIIASILIVPSVARADPDVVGDWLVGDGSATIRIRKCGAGFCGSVVSTRSPAGRDLKNPDPAKRRRSVIGIDVLSNMRPSGAHSWSGTSYNAEDGQTYETRMTMQGEGSLQIKGCVPNGGICGTETWTRIR